MNPKEYREERQIVPLEHKTNVALEMNAGYRGIVAKEESGAWMHCENPVGVER